MKPTLKTLVIENFKTHEKKEIDFGEFTEIYGGNAKGKTSIGEAIKFAFFPSVKNVSKIQNGKDKMTVTLTLETEKQEEIKIQAILDKEGTLKRTLLFKGVAHSKPATFLKEFVCFETFNPRDLLEKGKREEKLLSIIPLKVDKESVKGLPLNDPGLIDFDDHGVNVLKAIDKDLRNARQFLGRDKDQDKKSLDKAENELLEAQKMFEELFSQAPDISSEEVFKLQGALDNEKEKLQEDTESFLKAKKETEFCLEVSNKEKEEREERIKKLQNEINEEKKYLDICKCTISNYESILKGHQNKIKEFKDKGEEIANREIELKEKLLKARALKTVDERKVVIEKYKSDYQASYDKWKILEDAVKTDYPALRESVLKPLVEKVPGLSFEGGQFRINGTLLDELSESETISLGVELLGIQDKSSFILVDEAESLDSETVENAKWSKPVILLRVGDKPLGGKWRSVKV